MNSSVRSTAVILGTLAVLGCGPAEEPAKPPLAVDETALTTPPVIRVVTSTGASNQVGRGVRAAAAGTQYRVFGIGSGISGADLGFVQKPGGSSFNVNFTAPGNSFTEATYSERVAANPEAMWAPNGVWLQSGSLLDSEQAEIHFVWDMTTGGGNFDRYRVELDYEVASEEGFDFLWINSTSPGNCNSPGMVHKKVSGDVREKYLTFQIYRSCRTGWVGIYYIKDGSLARNGDYARIRNVKIYGDVPPGTR